jgi:hypothetical protein
MELEKLTLNRNSIKLLIFFSYTESLVALLILNTIAYRLLVKGFFKLLSRLCVDEKLLPHVDISLSLYTALILASEVDRSFLIVLSLRVGCGFFVVYLLSVSYLADVMSIS